MKLPTIPPELAREIVKNRPLSEPIILQNLENSPPPSLPRWQAEKKKTLLILMQCLQLFIAYELQINFWAC